MLFACRVLICQALHWPTGFGFMAIRIRVPSINMPSAALSCRIRAHGDLHSRAKHQYVKCRAILPTSRLWRFASACQASACRTLIRPAIPASRNAMSHMTSPRRLRCIVCTLYSISLACAPHKPAPKTCKFRPSSATFRILSTCKPFFFHVSHVFRTSGTYAISVPSKSHVQST